MDKVGIGRFTYRTHGTVHLRTHGSYSIRPSWSPEYFIDVGHFPNGGSPCDGNPDQQDLGIITPSPTERIPSFDVCRTRAPVQSYDAEATVGKRFITITAVDDLLMEKKSYCNECNHPLHYAIVGRLLNDDRICEEQIIYSEHTAYRNAHGGMIQRNLYSIWSLKDGDPRNEDLDQSIKDSMALGSENRVSPLSERPRHHLYPRYLLWYGCALQHIPDGSIPDWHSNECEYSRSRDRVYLQIDATTAPPF